MAYWYQEHDPGQATHSSGKRLDEVSPTHLLKEKYHLQGVGREGAPETGAEAPAEKEAVTTGGCLVGIPMVMAERGGTLVPVAAVTTVTDAGVTTDTEVDVVVFTPDDGAPVVDDGEGVFCLLWTT